MSDKLDKVFERMTEELEICTLRESLGRQCADCILVGSECLRVHDYFNLNIPERNRGQSLALVMGAKNRRRKPQ